MKLRKRRGFSVVGIAIAAAALVILTSVILPKGEDTISASKKNSDFVQIAAIANAVSQYKYEVGNYPPNLAALLAKNGVYGPWLPKLPTADIWGTSSTGINGTGGTSAYCYSYTSSGFAVWSFGKNKANNSGGSATVLPASFGGDDYGLFGR